VLHLPELAARIGGQVRRRLNIPFIGGKPVPAPRTAP
jgi:hypothetical protein